MTQYPDYTGTAQKLLEQQREINELRAKIKELETKLDQANALALDACDRRNFAYMERDELAELLLPFAEAARAWDYLSQSGQSFSASDVVPLSMEPYQAARDALARIQSA